MRDGHDARRHRRLAAAGRAARRIALLPGVGRVAEHGALGGRRHRVLGRRRAAQDVDARGPEQLGEVRIGLHQHALAQARAELDFAALLVAEHVLDQERHAAEGAVAQLLLVEAVDAVGIELHHRLERSDRSSPWPRPRSWRAPWATPASWRRARPGPAHRSWRIRRGSWWVLLLDPCCGP